MLYKSVLRPLLFQFAPESAHEFAMRALSGFSPLAKHLPSAPFTQPSLKMEVGGLTFPNPIGIAAGCDKNGVAIPIWHRFGFGFIEVGTITAQPQSGNPKPRVFRYPEQEALINRLGFNSEGSERVAERIAALRRSYTLPVPLAINIGKTKVVEGDEATLEDYRTSFRRLAPFADMVVVNVSSPNTPGLRQMQTKEKLVPLLRMLKQEVSQIQPEAQQPKALFVKISPDMNHADLDDAAETVFEVGFTGIIATNTTIAREGVASGWTETGGLSGNPLRERSLATLRYLYKQLQGKVPLIGVGGISTVDDAWERLQAGATLLQCYTALIYQGPYLPLRLNHGLVERMEREGVRHISEIVGTET